MEDYTGNRLANSRQAAQTLAFLLATLLLAGAFLAAPAVAQDVADEAAPETEDAAPAATFNGYEVETAQIMPLASRSLLLDVETTSSGLVAVGSRGHILVSRDGGDWKQVEDVPTRFALTAVTFIGNQGWAVGHGTVILHSDDGGTSWELQYLDPDLDQPLLSVLFVDENTGFAGGAYGLLMRTTDGGETWEESLIDEELDYHLNGMAQATGGNLFIAAEAGYGFVSEDAGDTWQPMEMPYPGSMFGVVALPSNRLLAYGLRGNMLFSANGGLSWQDLGAVTQDSLIGGDVSPSGTITLVGANGIILQAPATGGIFSAMTHPEGVDLAASELLQVGDLIMVGENGLSRLSEMQRGQMRAGASQ